MLGKGFLMTSRRENPLVDSFVRLSRLDATQRAALALVAAEIVLAAGVLAWVRSLPVLVAVVTLLLATAWGFVLSAGVFLRHPARWLALGLYAAAQVVVALYSLPAGWLPALIALLAVGLAAGLTAVLIPRWERYWLGDRVGRPALRFKVVTWLLFTAVALGGLLFGSAERSPLLAQLVALQLVLIPFLLVAGSDWAELGLAAIETVVQGLERVGQAIIVDVVAGALAVYVLVSTVLGISLTDVPLLAWELVMAGAVVGGVLWLARRWHARREVKVMYRAALGAALLTTAAAIFPRFLGAHGDTMMVDAELAAAVLWLLLLAGLVLRLPDIGTRRGTASAAWLLVATAGLVYLVQGADALRGHFGIGPGQIPLGLLQGLGVLAATGILLGLWMSWRGRRRTRARAATRPLMAFILAAMLLGLVSQAYLAEPGAPVTGLVLLVALSWELASSGKSVLNRDGRTLTRQVRCFLFLAYLAVVAADLVFNESIADILSLPTIFKVHQLAQDGIAALGIPVLVFVTINSLRRALASVDRSARVSEPRGAA
jgi:hypothetical protein